MTCELCSLFSTDSIRLGFKGRNKKEVLRELAALLSAAGGGEASFLEGALLTREALCSTAMGHGTAAPHALGPFIRKTALAFLRPETPLDWKSPDGLPVELVFAMAGPSGDPGTHLRLLSRLTRLVRNEDFRKELLSAPSAEAVIAAFKRRAGS